MGVDCYYRGGDMKVSNLFVENHVEVLKGILLPPNFDVLPARLDDMTEGYLILSRTEKELEVMVDKLCENPAVADLSGDRKATILGTTIVVSVISITLLRKEEKSCT